MHCYEKPRAHTSSAQLRSAHIEFKWKLSWILAIVYVFHIRYVYRSSGGEIINSLLSMLLSTSFRPSANLMTFTSFGQRQNYIVLETKTLCSSFFRSFFGRICFGLPRRHRFAVFPVRHEDNHRQSMHIEHHHHHQQKSGQFRREDFSFVSTRCQFDFSVSTKPQ